MKIQKTLTCLLTIISINVHAGISVNSYAEGLKEITALEVSGRYKIGAVKAAGLANKIADRIQMDQTVRSVENFLEVDLRETVVNKKRASAEFDILGFIRGSAYESYDVTKILVTNPEDVESFSHSQRRDLIALQRKVRSYLMKNESDIFYAKIFAAKSLQLTGKMNVESVGDIQDLILRTAQRVSRINFLGVQNILSCKTTHYAKKTESRGVELKAFLFSFGAREKNIQRAHTEKTCESSANIIAVSDDSLFSADLLMADENLETQAQVLGLKLLQKKAPFYPMWGW